MQKLTRELDLMAEEFVLTRQLIVTATPEVEEEDLEVVVRNPTPTFTLVTMY